MSSETKKPKLICNNGRTLSWFCFYSYYFVILLILAIVIQFTTPVESATVLRIGMPGNGNAPSSSSKSSEFGMASTSGLCLQFQKRARHNHRHGRGLLRPGLSSLRNFQSFSSCSCGRILCPVCGSDGVTYNNLCEFHCANDMKKELSISHRGRCSSKRRRKNKNNAEAA